MQQKEFEARMFDFQKRLKEEPDLEFIKKLSEAFPEIEIYAVGGAVRDAALGAANQKDYDFVLRNIQPESLEKFLAQFGTINLVGKTFGVYKFQPRTPKLSEAIDIAFPRTEHAFCTGGYRDVETKSDPKMPISEDLSRRDFTINAIAFDVKNKKIVDPYGGLKDLVDKRIRAVGDPHKRFTEDYSRLLRGLRFACQFGFEFEQKTYKALCKMVPHINNEREIAKKKERVLPYEVIAKELIKAFYYNPTKAFDLYDKTGAFKMLMPEILKMKACPQPPEFHSEGDVWVHTRLVLEKLGSEEFKKEFGEGGKNPELVIAALLHDIGKPKTIKTPERDKADRIRFDGHDIIGGQIAGRICRRLKLDSLSEKSSFRINPERIEQLVKYHMLTIEGNIEQMRPGTTEKYFFSKNFPGESLMKLTFIDALSTVPLSGVPSADNFYAMQKRIEELRERFEKKAKLPSPILDGFEMMEHFKLKPGPKVGELISKLRDAQLDIKKPIKTKKEAYKFLKNYLLGR
jgi:poly(A) polymerase